MSEKKLKRVLGVKWWRAYLGCCNSLLNLIGQCEKSEDEDIISILEYGSYLEQEIARSIFNEASLSGRPYIEKTN